MKFDIKKSSQISSTYKSQLVKGKFDLSGSEIVEEFTGEIPIENLDRNVGVIVGPSGTGKSTIAKELFGDNFINFTYSDQAIIDELEGTVDEITDVFNKVGFNTPKSRLKPYSVLSNGEKMRVDLAKAILSKNEVSIFDEYTSVVDRNVAKIGSYSLQKNIRKQKKKFIAVSCHYDILERLEPDRIFDTAKMAFIRGMMSPDTKDRQLNSESDIEQSMNGEYLGNITI